MFILVKLKDTVVILPKYFGSDLKEVIEHELNARFANKVIYKVGLCVSLWDILDIQESFISDVDGAYHTPVTCRFVCFRPSVDEILLGTVKACTKSGIRVSMNFFDDIFIPADKLRYPSRFDYEQNCWIWEYDYDGETAELKIERNDTIRFRVVEEIWRDPNPDGPPVPSTSKSELTALKDGLDDDQISPTATYALIGSMVADGLGVTCWWVN